MDELIENFINRFRIPTFGAFLSVLIWFLESTPSCMLLLSYYRNLIASSAKMCQLNWKIIRSLIAYYNLLLGTLSSAANDTIIIDVTLLVSILLGHVTSKIRHVTPHAVLFLPFNYTQTHTLSSGEMIACCCPYNSGGYTTITLLHVK